MASQPPWDPVAQERELNAWRRHQETSLALSGALLALLNAILAAELLAVNEDTNTFLVVGALGLAMDLSWFVIARRAAGRAERWAMKARRIEREVLRVPDRLSLWEDASDRGLPAWIAAGAVLVGFTVLWVGLMAYAYWATYIVR